MSLRINTNIPAMGALRNLEQTNVQMSATISRLSTGMRINSAGDDPAGLIISEGMRSQMRGLQQAIRNSQDAVNMAKTAESALEEAQRLLRDIRGLAVHSANTAVVDAAVLQANQTQIRSTLQSLNRIAEQTQFGTKKLLSGAAGVMANITSGANVSNLYMGATFNGENVVNGPITIARITQAVRASAALGNTFVSANTVVTASGTFVINGHSFSSDGTETIGGLVAKINERSGATGVTAEISGTSPNLSVTLRQNQYGSQHNIQFFDPSNILHNAASAGANGVNAVYNVSVTTGNGVQTSAFTGGSGADASGLRLSDNYGNMIVLTEAGNANVSAATQVGVVNVGAVRFQIGANEGQGVQFSMPTVYADRLGTEAVPGKTLADIDVTSQQGAEEAMKLIDNAITQLAQMRGELGSFQKNFLESTVRSLGVAHENMTASESAIRDANMAEEITEYTRLQILQQSGMSVLAQANQAPQNILSLLRGS